MDTLSCPLSLYIWYVRLCYVRQYALFYGTQLKYLIIQNHVSKKCSLILCYLVSFSRVQYKSYIHNIGSFVSIKLHAVHCHLDEHLHLLAIRI